MARASPPSLPGCAAGQSTRALPFSGWCFPSIRRSPPPCCGCISTESLRKPGDVNAYAASSFYAVDRYASWKKVWQGYYEAGGLVLADRYTTSNAVHQSSKVPPEERLAFFQWLFDFEYGRLGLPEPDLVLYLDMPTERAVDMLRQRERDTHTQGDIHETDSAYLATCRQAALEAAERYGWTKIPCLDQEGRLRRIDEIHQDIWQAVRPLLETKER